MSEPLALIVETLQRVVDQGDALATAFAQWLEVSSEVPALAAEGLWLPREVAAAGLVEASGKAASRPFAAGLVGLQRRKYFDPNLPPGFENDPLAIFGVAVGVRSLSDKVASQWLVELAEQAAQGEANEWRLGLLQAARFVLGVGNLPCDPEIAVALAARGFGTVEDGVVAEALRRATRLDETSPEQSAVRLAVIAFAARRATVSSPEHARGREPAKAVKILFLASNPSQSTQLHLGDELRDIKARLRAASRRDEFELVSEHAVQPDDVEQALLEHRPVVVHFSGHGSGVGGIVFHGAEPGRATLVAGDALADLFQILKDDIRVVVLNACYSEVQARGIARVVDFVVGMSDTIGDEAARKFAASFYRGLGFGRSVKVAFDLGVNALKREGLFDDVNAPRLVVRVGASTDDTLVGPQF